MYCFLNDFDYTTNFCIYNNYNSMQKSPSYIVFKQHSYDNFNLKYYITFVIQQIYTHTQSLRQDPNSYKCFMHMYNLFLQYRSGRVESVYGLACVQFTIILFLFPNVCIFNKLLIGY